MFLNLAATVASLWYIISLAGSLLRMLQTTTMFGFFHMHPLHEKHFLQQGNQMEV